MFEVRPVRGLGHADLQDAGQIECRDEEKNYREGDGKDLQEMTFASASAKESDPKIKQYHPNGRKSCE